MENKRWFEPGHVAIVTGASQGFGFAVAALLAKRGLNLVITARHAAVLDEAARTLHRDTSLVALAGDVADGGHVHALASAAQRNFGRIDLIVNNASTLGLSPMPALEHLARDTFDVLFLTNAFAPLHLIQQALPALRRTHGTIVNVSSDAAPSAYAGWGGYGASKAALEHLSRTLAVELHGSGVSVIVADPANMQTAMHRDAEPGEDLSSLPHPEAVAPALLEAIARPRDAFLRVELQSNMMPVTA
ncbi:MAG: SDR family oxidoreductase [Candidatus Eremiobacteraeota bacterium]|nr:SDR family oxidoreductase [Candidatus Eremiobacteraeota bacterium]MBC5822949.1 SDR family oxidoreductase [Candidatus Eremiobacteraeota bacterium]